MDDHRALNEMGHICPVGPQRVKKWVYIQIAKNPNKTWIILKVSKKEKKVPSVKQNTFMRLLI